VKAYTPGIYSIRAWACYKIMNAERKTLVERHLGRASVRPMGIKPHGIRNKTWGWSSVGTRNQETEQEHA
jgi:hypothetical protein